MKMKLTMAWSLLMLVAFGSALRAQGPAADPLADNLFPPELVMNHQAEIGLTEKQREALVTQFQQAEERFKDLQQKLQKEVAGMTELLKKMQIETEAALAQFDKVLEQERQIKRAHLALVLSLKNKLTAEQQIKLREIKIKMAAGQLRSPEETQRNLQAKLQKVQQGAQQWQDDGRDPSAAAELMREFDPLMKQGKHKEAEALLDRALKLLAGDK